ncbi:MAG TPA: hypothetical protein VMB73_10210 [Acetobacteraceae bacterium]|jgi:hypothetical protein|nr:hypothetical protein [Acetobacteraceae bacterium]
MASDQVAIDLLYARFGRSMLLLGLLVSVMWLIAALSYYLSRETGTDWFSRSGSLMALAGAVTSFRAVGVYQHKLAIALREGLVSVAREVELTLDPPRSFRFVTYSGYLTGIIGTAIWGYGDLLLR